MRLPTMRVLHKESGRTKIINKADFNPEIHEAAKGEKAGKKAENKDPSGSEDGGKGGGPEPVTIPTAEELAALDDEALKAAAEKIFDAKPPHNISREKLLERLEDLRARIDKAGGKAD